MQRPSSGGSTQLHGSKCEKQTEIATTPQKILCRRNVWGPPDPARIDVGSGKMKLGVVTFGGPLRDNGKRPLHSCVVRYDFVFGHVHVSFQMHISALSFVSSRRWVQGCRCLEQKYVSEQRICGAKCNGALALEKILWGL